jgi:hypothetical protein
MIKRPPPNQHATQRWNIGLARSKVNSSVLRRTRGLCIRSGIVLEQTKNIHISSTDGR